MSVIDDYLAHVSPPQRAELERIRTIVKREVQDAEEKISYGIPALRFKKQPLVYFAAFKNHLSLFPTSSPTEILKDKLNDYIVSKGTIQFSVEKPLSEELIVEIVQLRLAMINDRRD